MTEGKVFGENDIKTAEEIAKKVNSFNITESEKKKGTFLTVKGQMERAVIVSEKWVLLEVAEQKIRELERDRDTWKIAANCNMAERDFFMKRKEELEGRVSKAQQIFEELASKTHLGLPLNDRYTREMKDLLERLRVVLSAPETPEAKKEK